MRSTDLKLENKSHKPVVERGTNSFLCDMSLRIFIVLLMISTSGVAATTPSHVVVLDQGSLQKTN
jgi:hypothetical protein